MITLTQPACQALCDYLIERGVKLPETYFTWCISENRTWDQHAVSLMRSAEYGSDDFIPAPTFSELITDWLPVLETVEEQPMFTELRVGGLNAVSSRVIEIIKDLK